MSQGKSVSFPEPCLPLAVISWYREMIKTRNGFCALRGVPVLHAGDKYTSIPINTQFNIMANMMVWLSIFLVIHSTRASRVSQSTLAVGWDLQG